MTRLCLPGWTETALPYRRIKPFGARRSLTPALYVRRNSTHIGIRKKKDFAVLSTVGPVLALPVAFVLLALAGPVADHV